MKRRDFIVKSSGVAAATLSYSQLYAGIQKQIEATHAQGTYDVIVLGVGSMGSSTCYHLAKRGLKVLGLEQFDIPHELGSHAGQSRLIRKAYGKAQIMSLFLRGPMKIGKRWNLKPAHKYTSRRASCILVPRTIPF